MPFLEVNNVKIFYTEKGFGDQTVVLSHGLLWSSKMFEDQINFLSARFRVIAFDHRGQGESEVSGPFDMETLTEDAAKLITHLCEGPVHFVGLSMGGFIGIRLASRYPELIKGLILLSTSANAEPVENLPKYKGLNSIVKWFGVVRPIARQIMPIMFGESWLSDPLNFHKVKFWKAQLKSNKKTITGPVEGVISRKAVVDDLKLITCKTLIITGGEDLAVKPEKSKLLQMGIAHATLHIVPGAGHSISIEKPKELNRLIGDWLVGIG